MKCSSTQKIIGTLWLLASGFASSSVFARAPLAREAHGVIQSMDYQKRILTLTYAQKKGPQKLIGNSDTQFLHNSKPVPATELKQGTPATVHYHYQCPFAPPTPCKESAFAHFGQVSA
jgi:hypothetical protein